MFDDLDLTGYYGTTDGAAVTPVEVAVVGDSSCTGPGLDHARDVFIAQAAARVEVPLHLTQFAVGGSRIGDVLMQQLPAVLDAQPAVAVISIGANDAIHSTPLARFERDLRAVVGALDRAGIETVVCGLIDLSLIPRIPTVLKPMLGLRGLAYERRKARATHPAARAVRAGADRLINETFRARGEALFTADRFHPNAAGHTVLADGLVPHLTAAVDRAMLSRCQTPCSTNATVMSPLSRITALTR